MGSLHQCVSIPTLPCIPSSTAPGDWDVFSGCCRQVCTPGLGSSLAALSGGLSVTGVRARPVIILPFNFVHNSALPREHRLVFWSCIHVEF
jgi:hypothetical protein